MMEHTQQNDNILFVLVYIFKHHFDELYDHDKETTSFFTKLTKQGFSQDTIHKAMQWLKNLVDPHTEFGLLAPSALSTRVWSPDECRAISLSGQRFILQMEQQKILSPYTRELTMTQLLTLEQTAIDLPLIKLIILMVLSTQPQEDTSLQMMEFLLLQPDARMH